MAKYLSKVPKTVTIGALCLLWTALPAGAQSLSDPTRPPASFGAALETSTEKAVSGPELQSVLISPTRRVATINGQSVRVGDKYGEFKVMRITENEVVLRNGSDKQVLKLFPQIEKQVEAGFKGGETKNRVK